MHDLLAKPQPGESFAWNCFVCSHIQACFLSGRSSPYFSLQEFINVKSIGFKIFHIPLDLSVSALLRGMLIYNRNSVGHLHYFTSDTAIATLTDCGYEIVDTMYTPSFADLPSKSWKAKLIKLPRFAL